MAVELTEDNHRQFFIPKGFAHDFAVLSETAVFQYKCDEFYHPEADGGISILDDTLGIDWKIPTEHANLSEGVRREGNAHPWAQYQLRAGQRVNVNLRCDAWTTHTQSKLVRCVKGAVLDVAVDIRKGSPTFGQHVSCLLTGRDDEGMKIAEQWEKEFLIPHP